MVNEYDWEALRLELQERKLETCRNKWITFIKEWSLPVPDNFDPRNWYVEYRRTEEILDTYICILRPIPEGGEEEFKSLFVPYLDGLADKTVPRIISECRIYQYYEGFSKLEEDNSLDNFLSEFVIK